MTITTKLSGCDLDKPALVDGDWRRWSRDKPHGGPRQVQRDKPPKHCDNADESDHGATQQSSEPPPPPAGAAHKQAAAAADDDGEPHHGHPDHNDHVDEWPAAPPAPPSDVSGGHGQESRKNLDSGYAWLILVVMFLLQSTISGASRVYGIVYAKEVAIGYYDRESASWPIATASAVENLASILTPALARVMSWRQIELLSSSLFILSNLLAYFSRSLLVDILALGAIQGLALSTCTVLTLAINNDYFERYRTTAYGIQMSGSTLGVLYLSPLVSWLLARFGDNFRVVYLALALVFCANLVLVLFIKPRAKTIAPPTSAKTKHPDDGGATEASSLDADDNNEDERHRRREIERIKRLLESLDSSSNSLNQLDQRQQAIGGGDGGGRPVCRKRSRFEWHFERKNSIASISDQVRSRRQSILSRRCTVESSASDLLPFAANAAAAVTQSQHNRVGHRQLSGGGGVVYSISADQRQPQQQQQKLRVASALERNMIIKSKSGIELASKFAASCGAGHPQPKAGANLGRVNGGFLNDDDDHDHGDGREFAQKPPNGRPQPAMGGGRLNQMRSSPTITALVADHQSFGEPGSDMIASEQQRQWLDCSNGNGNCNGGNATTWSHLANDHDDQECERVCAHGDSTAATTGRRLSKLSVTNSLSLASSSNNHLRNSSGGDDERTASASQNARDNHAAANDDDIAGRLGDSKTLNSLAGRADGGKQTPTKDINNNNNNDSSDLESGLVMAVDGPRAAAAAAKLHDLYSSNLVVASDCPLKMPLARRTIKHQQLENFLHHQQQQQQQQLDQLPHKQAPTREQQKQAHHDQPQHHHSQLEQSLRLLRLPYLHCTWMMLALYYLIARVFVIILVDFADDHGFTMSESTNLLNYWSVGELVGRVLLGSLIDLQYLSCKSCIVLTCALLAGAITLMVLIESYLIYAICSMCVAALISLEYMLINVLMVDYLGKEHVTSCYSLAACLASLVLFARPSLIGLFRDQLGSYDGLLLLLASSALIFAALFYLLEPLLVRKWPKQQLSAC